MPGATATAASSAERAAQRRSTSSWLGVQAGDAAEVAPTRDRESTSDRSARQRAAALARHIGGGSAVAVVGDERAPSAAAQRRAQPRGERAPSGAPGARRGAAPRSMRTICCRRVCTPPASTRLLVGRLLARSGESRPRWGSRACRNCSSQRVARRRRARRRRRGPAVRRARAGWRRRCRRRRGPPPCAGARRIRTGASRETRAMSP